jgi:cytochrome P450
MHEPRADTRFQLFGREFKANPYPTYAQMRAAAPILRRPLRHSTNQDLGICFVTRYADVAAMLRDTTRFVKNVRHTMTPQERATAPPPPHLFRLVSNHMLNQDAPDHTRLRNLVNRAFTVPMVERLAPRIEAVAHELIHRFAPSLRAGETVDLIEQFALPLPIIVIADLLGIPGRDHHRFRMWSHALVSSSADPVRMQRKLEKSGPLIHDFIAYLRKIFAARRAAPQDDLISKLLEENEAGSGQLSEDELFSMLLLLIVVGHETTVNLIGNGLLALVQRPHLWETLRANSTHIPAAVEETLRYDCPVERAPMRYAACDMEWHGVSIRRGDNISLVLGSANRDETQFFAPDEFRLDRAENRHLAFGLGPHYCLGAPLARLEGKLAFQALLDHFPMLTLAMPAPDLRWRPHPIMRGLTRLPIGRG